MKFQKHVIENNLQVCILFEGRDAAGKDGTIKQWKLSPIDAQAQKYWQAYSKARDTMFKKTSYGFAPWYVIHIDDKKTARINAIKHFIAHIDDPGKKNKLLIHDRKIICTVDPICYEKEMTAP